MAIKEINCTSYSQVEHGMSTVNFPFAEVKYFYLAVGNVHLVYGV